METIATPTCNASVFVPYAPISQNPWNTSNIKHVNRRFGFGASQPEVDATLSQSPGQFINSFVNRASNMPPTPAASWTYYSTDDFSNEEQNYEYFVDRRLKNIEVLLSENLRGMKMVKKIVRIFILLLSFNSFAQTNYFVDFSNGNDNNNGLTAQDAWKTLGKIESTNFQPGDVIALKSGEIWHEDLYLTSSSGSAGNPITITSYGSGAKPIISVMEEQNLSWTNVGSNIWRSSTVSNHPSRISIDGTERLCAAMYSELGASVPDLAKWHYESGQLYIYSSDSPANHTIEFSTTGTAVYLQNVDNLTLSNIEVIGGFDFGIKAYSCDNLTLRNLTTGKYSKYTINIDAYEPQGGGTGYKIPENLLIEDCIVDSNWNLDYSNSGRDQEHFQARGAYEGIRINIVGSGIIRNNFIKNWMHAGLSLTSPARGDLSRPIRDLKIYGNTLTGDEVAYGSKVAFDRVAYNIEFYNNFLYDIPNENSFNGWDNHVHHNIFLRVKGTALRTTNIGRAISIQGYAGEVYNNIYENNIMIDCDAAGMYISNSNNFDVHDNVFRNNIAYNCGINDSQYPNIGLLYKNGYASTYNNDFHNNIVYSSQTSEPYNFLYNVMNATEFNTQTGNDSDMSGNIQANPMFVNDQNDWRLLNGSPALDAAGPVLAQFDYSNNAIGANPEIGIYDGASNDQGGGQVTANAGADVSICEGESTTLTASGGVTYLWSTGATTASITVSPNTTQTYTVTAFDTNGNSDSDDVIVTVTSVTADAGADVTIEEGQSTTLTASGGTSYLWSTGATSQSITVSPLSTQTYSVIVTENGCDDTDDVIVTVNPSTVTANAGADVSICEGESTTLTASGGVTYLLSSGTTTTSGGDRYLWSTGETDRSITVKPDVTTTYSVKVFSGEDFVTDYVTVFIDGTCAINLEQEIVVYPNPTQGQNLLNIRLTGFNDKSNISLFDLKGMLVYSININNHKKDRVFNKKINLSRFANGTYLVRVNNKGLVKTKKVIVNN